MQQWKEINQSEVRGEDACQPRRAPADDDDDDDGLPVSENDG